jgi:hypothetical protein
MNRVEGGAPVVVAGRVEWCAEEFVAFAVALTAFARYEVGAAPDTRVYRP